MTIEFVTATPNLVIKDNGDSSCVQVDVPGYGRLGRSGLPALPVTGALLGVPPDAEIELKILDVAESVLNLALPVCPVPVPDIEQLASGEFGYRSEERVPPPDAHAASALYPPTVAELSSIGWIRNQRVAQVQFAPLQVNPAAGELRHVSRITVRVRFTPSAERTLATSPPAAAAMPVVFDDGLKRTLLNYEDARAWRVDRQAHQLALPVQALTAADPPAYKVVVDQDGLYQLDYAMLQGAGVPVDTLDPPTLRLLNRGEEVAIYVTGESDGAFDAGDTMLFYGEKTDTRFTDTNVYWLTWGSTAGLRMAAHDAAPGGAPTPVSFETTAHIEENHNYQTHIPSGPEDGDHWFWKYLLASSTAVTDTFTIGLDHIAAEPYSTTVRGELYGYSYFGPTPDHHTRVYLNGHLVDDVTWDGWREYGFEHEIPSSFLLEGENTITLALAFDLGPDVINDIVFVNWFEVDYHQTYTATNDLLDFTVQDPGTWELQVAGFTTETLSIFDITTPTLPVRVISSTAELGGSAYTLRFQNTINEPHRCLALVPSRILSSTAVLEDRPSHLRNPSNGADYLIITHGDFYTDVLPLAAYRATQGMRTAVVDVQDVYDEFNYGVFDPEAIHDFLTYAYGNWTLPAPTYVLLAGDGNYDFKNHLGRGEPTYIPPFLAYVDPWIGEVAADNRYACVAGDAILPDMHLGRLPVKTAAEAAGMVAKILAYEQSPPGGDWNRDLVFVADNPDDAAEFYDASEAIADHAVPSPYTTEKIYYLQPYSTAGAVKTALLNAVNDGRLMVNYVGHASIDFWGFEHFLDRANVAGLTNGGKQPFVAPMTCLEGYFIHPSLPNLDFSSVGEALVRVHGKGAIASWSPTGKGVASGHELLSQGLYTAIFQDDVTQLGPATTLAKFYLAANTGGHPELLDTYLLFGDPATRLNVLPVDVQLVKINYKMDVSPTDRDAASRAEVELRRRQARAVDLFREYVPGCEKAFIARTSPSLTIRRGRLVTCDYDITSEDVLEGRHFDDDIMAYGFHDSAPRLQIKDGGTYGIPYRALRVSGLDNLLAAGMIITSDHDAHMSTRNTVACMGQGQAAGTAAALCAQRTSTQSTCGTRDLDYAVLRQALTGAGVHLEN